MPITVELPVRRIDDFGRIVGSRGVIKEFPSLYTATTRWPGDEYWDGDEHESYIHTEFGADVKLEPGIYCFAAYYFGTSAATYYRVDVSTDGVNVSEICSSNGGGEVEFLEEYQDGSERCCRLSTRKLFQVLRERLPLRIAIKAVRHAPTT